MSKAEIEVDVLALWCRAILVLVYLTPTLSSNANKVFSSAMG